MTDASIIELYWYALPLRELAEKFVLNQNTVKTALHRTREKLRRFLREEGFQ